MRPMGLLGLIVWSAAAFGQIQPRPTPYVDGSTGLIYQYQDGDLLGTADSRILDGTSISIMWREFLDLANSNQGLRDIFLLLVEGYSSQAVANQLATATPEAAETSISQALAEKLISMDPADDSMQYRIRETLVKKEFDKGRPYGNSLSPLAYWIAEKSGAVQERLKVIYDAKARRLEQVGFE